MIRYVERTTDVRGGYEILLNPVNLFWLRCPIESF